MAQSNTTNLVYVFPDQLRYRSLSYAGDLLARTPNIDQFAAQGVSFTNAVASAPICTAYRASPLTGKYTTSHGMVINELRINPHQRCFGHMLTAAGYHTGYIGKWHLYANELGNHHAPRNSFVPRGPGTKTSGQESLLPNTQQLPGPRRECSISQHILLGGPYHHVQGKREERICY